VTAHATDYSGLPSRYAVKITSVRVVVIDNRCSVVVIREALSGTDNETGFID
jgi:hypothetical protein